MCAKRYTDIKNGTVHVVSLHLCWGRDRRVLIMVYKTHLFIPPVHRGALLRLTPAIHMSVLASQNRKKGNKNWKNYFSQFWPQHKFSVWTRKRRRSQSFPLAARKTKPSGLCSQNTTEREWTPQCPAGREKREKELCKCWVLQNRDTFVIEYKNMLS